PEALSSLVLNITIATIGLIGASAMAGTVGGGGLGDLAIAYGYQRFETDIMFATVIVLIVLVQLVQTFGNKFSRMIRRR
ncbi:methionine ABC transporter permease, partial [Escherichia coli]|nr:methionine ABC transporter permease [Escherichia coli]